jgi:integrase
MTPLAKENVWRRSIGPALQKAGLGHVNFQIMRRTAATLMNVVGGNGKLIADQLGHSLDTSANVYVQSPIDLRIPILNELERFIQAE